MHEQFVFAGLSPYSDALGITIPPSDVSAERLIPLLGHKDTRYFVKQQRYVAVGYVAGIDRVSFAADVLSILCGILKLNIAEINVAIDDREIHMSTDRRYEVRTAIHKRATFSPMDPPQVQPGHVAPYGTAPAYWLLDA